MIRISWLLLCLLPALARAAGAAQAPADSVVYRLDPATRLVVKTGKAGLFGFAGHSHLIQARAFHGEVVYYPRDPASSRVDITVLTAGSSRGTPAPSASPPTPT